MKKLHGVRKIFTRIVVAGVVTTGVAATRDGVDLVAGTQASAAVAGQAWEQQCEAATNDYLPELIEAPIQVVSSKPLEAAQGLPAHCEMTGYVAPRIWFKLSLPVSAWNEKLFMSGCGASCGSVETSYNEGCDEALRRNYACVFTDTGHRSGMFDGSWARDDLQAQVDYGYRAIHVVAVAAKAMTEHYLKKLPRKSYFWGCSTGGRQALVAAQRFPWDFEAIIAGAPWIDDTLSMMTIVWAINALRYPSGAPLLTQGDLDVLHKGALEKCDLDDNVKDGVISSPLTCRFDPRDLVCKTGDQFNCLSPIKAEAARKSYDGPRDSSGRRIFSSGVMPGSELQWNQIVPTQEQSLTLHGQSLGFEEIAAIEYFRHGVMPAKSPSWKLTDINFDQDHKSIGATSETLLNAANPDLRRFKENGGKLIIYMGWNDPLFSIPGKTVDYYETVTRTMGGPEQTRNFARLFMVPGMGHCGGGEGVSAIDFLTHIEQWSEQGRAPDMVIGHRKDSSGPKMVRPIYPYPSFARYKGRGEHNDVRSYGPVQTGPTSSHLQ